MTLACLLSKEHPELPAAELRAVLTSLGKVFEVRERSENLVLLDVSLQSGDYPSLARLAMTREVTQLSDRISYQQLGQGLQEIKLNNELSSDTSFAVRSESIARKAPKDLEESLGALIREETGANVDLEHPDVVYRVYCLEDELLLGRLQVEIDRSQYEARRNQDRPFSHPTSLHPRLARAMVNLAAITEGDSLLDPFVGTGGILIEVGLIGCRLYGMDISSDMLQGARTNLQAYSLSDYHLQQGDVKYLSSLFSDQSFEAIVTDTPYGRASKQVGKTLTNFIDQLESFSEANVVFTSDQSRVRGLQPDFSLYVHKNLTKYIYRL